MSPRDASLRMASLADEQDSLKRRLVALGLLSRELEAAQIEPILVGGAALEFYTAGGYATKDVDLALPLSPLVDEAFARLGFEKEGRYWYREDLDLLFEAPAPAGLPGEDAARTEIEVEGLRVVVIGVEDLLLDRLRAAVHWDSTDDARWARRLATLYFEELDLSYLGAKVADNENEREELAAILSEASES
ncbi:MAG: UbiD family decarboxylase [Acidobacteria bacterium]|nr:UbiD family decarboxylase [Acidobacteriota bacterium]